MRGPTDDFWHLLGVALIILAFLGGMALLNAAM